MDCVKRQVMARHLEKLNRPQDVRKLLEQCQNLATNGSSLVQMKPLWMDIGGQHIAQLLQVLEREPQGFETLIFLLMHGSKDSEAVAYDMLGDSALCEEDIDGLLNDVKGEVSEVQEMKITLIKERKKNQRTTKELEKLKRNSLIFDSGRNSPDESQFLSSGCEIGRVTPTPIDDLLEELENERKRREEAEKEVTAQRQRSQKLKQEHVQTKKELDEIKRRSFAFSDHSDYASYQGQNSDGELDFDQEVPLTSSEGVEGNSVGMYDCDEGIWGKCRYGTTHLSTEQAVDFETACAPSEHVVGALVSKICDLEDKLETEKAQRHISHTEILRLQQENAGLRSSMEDIVSALSIEDEFEVVHNDETETQDGYQFIDECCQALENTAFEDDHECDTVTGSDSMEACSAMSIQASGTWRSLNTLHYEFDDYDNVIEKPIKKNAGDLKDALRELRLSTKFLRNQVQREGMELKALRNRMQFK